jgi:hypothetical protein
LKDIQGRIYHFKSKTECAGLGILYPVIPNIVRYHMILILDIMPGKDYVKFMTVSAQSFLGNHLLSFSDHLDPER